MVDGGWWTVNGALGARIPFPPPLVASPFPPPLAQVLSGSNLDEGTIFMYLTPRIRCQDGAEALDRWATGFYTHHAHAHVHVVLRVHECTRAYVCIMCIP